MTFSTTITFGYGTGAGQALGWSWARSVPFGFASYQSAGYGVSRFEGFEYGWGCDTLVDALVIPTNAEAAEFNAAITPVPYESFEKGWRLPNSHALVQSGIANPFGDVAPFALANGETLNLVINAWPELNIVFVSGEFANIGAATAQEVVNAINLSIGDANIPDAYAYADLQGHVLITTDETGAGASIQVLAGTANAALGYVVGTYVGGVNASHPGNETALFAFGGASATFNTTIYPPGEAFENFEAGWPSNQVYYTAFSQVPSSAAAFATTIVSPPTGQPFESFEVGWKDNQAYFFSMGPTTAATFSPLGNAFENFENVKADQLISANSSTSTFTCVGHGFSNGNKVTLYAGGLPNGTAGVMPTGINSLLTFFVVGATTNTFQISQTSGGSPQTFSDNGNGPLYVKADPSQYWTQTTVGV